MDNRKYEVDKITIKSLLSDISQEKISTPEIQRPFVWKASKVRDLIDSINRGFPIGYIIVSTDPQMVQKDGTKANGRISIIDGQQRITALRAAILGELVVDKNYKKIRIKIAYNPLADVENGENQFETLTPAIEKSPHWIKDISRIVDADFASVSAFIKEYREANPDISEEVINQTVTKLQSLRDQEIGLIRLLAGELSIDEVAEIFERINSKGVSLNQADFAMSKLASGGTHGNNVRKIVEYFAHIIKDADFYEHIHNNDQDFRESGLLSKISWAKDFKNNIYVPDYSDIIRTAFTYNFHRGKLADLVSLLSGRNFETRAYEQKIADQTVVDLESAVLDYTNHGNFTDFVQIIDSTGFIDAKMIGSQNALNYAYAIFLLMKKQNYNPSDIKKYISKWFVMSVLTSRYSSSPESTIDRDIKDISRLGIAEYLSRQAITEEFWSVNLFNDFDRASMQHPYLNTYFAAQVYFGENGFLGDVGLRNIREIKGDIHHTFPYDYLRTHGKNNKTDYNQIANFVYMEKSTNIQIGKMKPSEYMEIVYRQAREGKLDDKHPIGKITNLERLKENLIANCIPAGFETMDVADYDRYLVARRKLMIAKIKKYYNSL